MFEVNVKPYRWLCHVCRAPNEANAERCASCGFPSEASALDIERERRARGEAPDHALTRDLAREANEWRLSPIGAKVRRLVLGALALITVLFARLAPMDSTAEWAVLGLLGIAMLVPVLSKDTKR